jgi:hypothetical protein
MKNAKCAQHCRFLVRLNDTDHRYSHAEMILDLGSERLLFVLPGEGRNFVARREDIQDIPTTVRCGRITLRARDEYTHYDGVNMVMESRCTMQCDDMTYHCFYNKVLLPVKLGFMLHDYVHTSCHISLCVYYFSIYLDTINPYYHLRRRLHLHT